MHKQEFFNMTGVILPYGGDSVPAGSGWLLCDGASLLRTDYPTLFTAIGVTFGSADGTHFNVPDLRGLFIRGKANGSSNDSLRSSRTCLLPGSCCGDHVGSYQTYGIKSHSHCRIALQFTVSQGGNGIDEDGGSGGSVVTTSCGGNEDRPSNLTLNYIIKY